MSKIVLYHTGYQVIQNPDIYYGRKNADFGQGFYLTENLEFSKRWAREKKGTDTYVNVYGLELHGLQIHRFQREEAWFDYIYGNRNGKKDTLSGMDVIIGPIANDTIYDTLGITTSGFLDRNDALKLFLIGPLYEQVVIKTEQGRAQLSWLSADKLESSEIIKYREIVQKEEQDYQILFAECLENL